MQREHQSSDAGRALLTFWHIYKANSEERLVTKAKLVGSLNKLATIQDLNADTDPADDRHEGMEAITHSLGMVCAYLGAMDDTLESIPAKTCGYGKQWMMNLIRRIPISAKCNS